MKKMDFKLYLVADISLADSPEDYIWKVEEAIKGGVTLVQLRAKELTTKEMLKLGKLLKDVLDKYN
ncbi:MAG: thiamine phosphate synthase, partial [bacterium]